MRGSLDRRKLEERDDDAPVEARLQPLSLLRAAVRVIPVEVAEKGTVEPPLLRPHRAGEGRTLSPLRREDTLVEFGE